MINKQLYSKGIITTGILLLLASFIFLVTNYYSKIELILSIVGAFWTIISFSYFFYVVKKKKQLVKKEKIKKKIDYMNVWQDMFYVQKKR